MNSQPLKILWSRPWLRRLFWLILTLITLWCLLAAILSWSGQRRWRALQADLAAQNEGLELFKLLPAPIPELKNLAAIEPLHGIRLGKGSSPVAKSAEAKRQALESSCQFLQDGKVGTALQDPGLLTARPPEMAKIIRILSEQKILDLAPEADAQVLRQALEKHLPLLTKISSQLEARPDTEFLPRWESMEMPPNLYALQLPHYLSIQNLSQMLRLHGLACLAANDGAAAVRDAICILRLAKGILKEPVLIAHLVAVSLHHKAADLAWCALEKRLLNDAQLQSLRSEFSSLPFSQSLLQASRAEMIFAAEMASRLEANPQEALGLTATMLSDDSVLEPTLLMRALVGIVPNGFFTHMKTTIVEIPLNLLVRPLRENGLINTFTMTVDRELKQKNLLLRPDYILAKFSLPSVQGIWRITAYQDTVQKQILIACQLEQHFLQAGSYPSSLPSDAPASFDGTAMHYVNTKDGRYRLWHLGPDGKDDGGSLPKEKSSASTQSNIRNADYLGDWTWRYEASQR